MNNIQKLVYEVSGINPLTDEYGAKNDGYFACHDESEKLSFLLGLDYYSLHLNLTSNELFQAYRFLETDFTNLNDLYHAFKDLV